MKAIQITLDEWQKIVVEIAKHHPKSVWMVRPKMRKVLGFTPREHTEWLGYYDNVSKADKKAGRHGYKTMIHLDFYNESQRTMFLLKYGDFIDTNREHEII